jgi:hypothetical protein
MIHSFEFTKTNELKFSRRAGHRTSNIGEESETKVCGSVRCSYYLQHQSLDLLKLLSTPPSQVSTIWRPSKKHFRQKLKRYDSCAPIIFAALNTVLTGSTCYCDFRHCWLSSEGGYCVHFAGNGEWRRRHNRIGRTFLRSHSGWACHSRDQHSMFICLI